MEKEITVGLVGNESTRRGVYANSFNVVTSAKDAYIDFAFLDGQTVENDGDTIHEGMHQARVIMSHSTLAELCNFLNGLMASEDKEVS